MPFFGVGIGYARVMHSYTFSNANIKNTSLDSNVFIYQVMLGTNIKLSKKTRLLLEYKALATTQARFLSLAPSLATGNNETLKDNIFAHSFNAGITVFIA